MIDTHTHLDACAEPPDLLLARAAAAGVEWVVTIGAGLESCRAALALASTHAQVFAVLGVDPHTAGEAPPDAIDELRALHAGRKVVAVGETGLDYHYGADRADEQRRLFDAQLALAADLERPVVVHCREAAADTAAVLAGFPGEVVLHCFSEPDLLETALERRYYVSFAGNVTYPRNAELRVAAARVPPDRVLAETDAPYLAPQGLRGRPSEPAHIVHTVRVLAAARGEEEHALTRHLDGNARRVFGLP